MDKKQILKAIAPCGLNCLKCFAYEEGFISKEATRLKELLGNFKVFAKKFESFHKELESYADFEKVLGFLAKGSCKGCRSGECLNGACKAQACAIAEKVELCVDCNEFPCSSHNFPKGLDKLWVLMNNRIKEVGLQTFFEESMQKERYPFS